VSGEIPAPRELRTEDARDPLGVDADEPRFSWLVPDSVGDQTAYRIRVARRPEDLDADPVWDSGWIDGGERTLVPYGGPELDAGTCYRWTVRIRGPDGDPSARAGPACFETAPEGWVADWLAPGESHADDDSDADRDADPAPAFRTEFDLEAPPARARLYAAVAGTCECKLNGERVGDAVLDTGQSDYEERVLYATQDVTEHLREGANAVGATLGRERYALTTENTWGWHDPPWRAEHPHLRLQIEVEYPDGRTETVATGSDWRVADSPTRFDSFYEGERYDARDALGAWTRPGYDHDSSDSDADWDHARVVDGPDGDPTPQRVQPMRVVDRFEPEAVSEPVEGSYVFDFGVMTAGWAELAVAADWPAGTEIELTYGEKRREDGTVNVEQDHIDARIQTDRYVCASGEQGPERWAPRFSYKGFRYVQVDGLPEGFDPETSLLTAEEIHTTVEETAESEWESSSELLNHIHRNCRRALLNNHHSIPTDTPVYEKNGWTGDAQLTAETALYNFEMVRFYRKWLADVADAQRPNGEVPPIVPTSDWGYTDSRFEGFEEPIPAWDAAYVLVPWWTYQYCGDRRLLETHYEGMKSLVDFHGEYAGAGDSAADHILDIGLGDWVAPGHGEIRSLPPEGQGITGTAYHYAMADTVAAVADVLGAGADRETYASLAADVKSAFNTEFLDAEAGIYATGEADDYRQTSNVLPLAFGLVPDGQVDAVVENLVSDVTETHDGHLNTGILGTKYLLPVLTERGHVDTAYTVATQRDYPSWGNFLEDGATALYEHWTLDARTRDHHMFGSIDEWFYKHLAGVRPTAPGFAAVTVEPYVPTDLDRVAATVDTVRGDVRVRWETSGPEALSLAVEIPPGTDAAVHVPGASGDGDLRAPDGADAERTGDRWACSVGAGEWSFTVE
jgi:alpha-L-rhamnosidase